MKRTDQQICVDAVRSARRILSEYIEPGSPHDAVAAVYLLLDVFDNYGIEGAMERIDSRSHFRVVTLEHYGMPKDDPGKDKG